MDTIIEEEPTEEPIIEEPVSFLNPKKERLWGFLSLPRTENQVPALIMCHGFAKTKSERKFVELARSLAQKGIASLRFDFSGHGDSKGSLINFGIQQAVEDLRAAHQYLVQNKIIDQNRIAILGHSLGALVAVLFQEKYKKAKTLILLSPALHQRELIKKWYSPKFIALWRRQGYLDIPKGRLDIQYLNEAESKDWAEFASRIKISILILHGAQDKDVPLKYAKDIFKKLNYKKELELVENTDHHFESYEAINKLNEISWKWLRQNL